MATSLHAADQAAAPPAALYPLCLPPVACGGHWLGYGELALWAMTSATLEEHLAAAQRLLQEKTSVAAPLVDALHKAEAELVPAQQALSDARHQAALLQKNIEALAAQSKQISDSRAASDAERTNVSATLAQVQAAQPLVAEALRHLTEAVGKAPADTALAEAHRQLTEKLKAMEANATELQTKSEELVGAVAAADAKLKESAAQAEAARRQSAAVAERVAALEAQVQQLAAALEAARREADPAQAEIAQATREVERWQNEITFRDQMAALEKELVDARQLAAARQAELETANNQLADAKSAVDSATVQRDQAAHAVDAIHARIQAARAAKK
jgi:chromosome segregation ATPase